MKPRDVENWQEWFGGAHSTMRCHFGIVSIASNQVISTIPETSQAKPLAGWEHSSTHQKAGCHREPNLPDNTLALAKTLWALALPTS